MAWLHVHLWQGRHHEFVPPVSRVLLTQPPHPTIIALAGTHSRTRRPTPWCAAKIASFTYSAPSRGRKSLKPQRCASDVFGDCLQTIVTDPALPERFIYSVFTEDTLDEKGQARNTSTHVTFNALNSTKNSPVASG